MKLLAVLCLAVAVAASPAPKLENDVQVLRYENHNPGYGTYRYAFEQSDGTKHEQQGELRKEGREDEYIAVKGTFSWVAPDGVTYAVTYVADENGYHPKIGNRPKIDHGYRSGVPPSVFISLIGGLSG